MVKLTGGYIGNDIAPKNIRYIAGGGSPNNKNIRVPTPEELRERQIKKKLRELQKKKKRRSFKPQKQKSIKRISNYSGV